jgi:hypothetical protein
VDHALEGEGGRAAFAPIASRSMPLLRILTSRSPASTRSPPGYPKNPFADIEKATLWVDSFIRWYNTEHLHSGIRFVPPSDRHEGRDRAILAARHRIYTKARSLTPRRWTGGTRNWTPVGTVRLNPEKRDSCSKH